MKVPEPHELNSKQMDGITEFIKEAFFLTDKENAALDGVVPMTYEMYKHLGERLLEIGCDKHYYKLLLQYPDFLQKEADELMEDLRDIPELQETEEEKKASWERLKQRIREKYGENVI